MKGKDKIRYRALVLLWHSREERYIRPGEDVDLSHLSPEDIQRLLDAGVVEEIWEREVNDGTDDRRDLYEELQG